MKLIQLLKRPFYSDTRPAYWIKMSFLFGAFVFLFLYIFRPFEIESINGDLILVCLSFGGITTASMLILDLLFLPFLVKKVCEENWNVGLSITWTLVHIGIIAILNSIYFSYTFLDGFEWKNLLWFFISTLLVSLFPVSLVFILQERRDSKKFENQSDKISEHINEYKLSESDQQITIKSKNTNEDLILKSDQLLYMQSADNYITVYYLDNVLNSQKAILRNTLSAIANDLEQYQHLFHCHRSYLVNLNKVVSVSGNAQGFKLHLDTLDYEIPVSRKFNDFIKIYFDKRQSS